MRFSTLNIVKYLANILKQNMTLDQFENIINSVDSHNRNAVILAIISDDVRVLDYLYKELKLNIIDTINKNLSHLHYAMSRNSQQVFRYLLLHGCNFQKEDEASISKNRDFQNYFNSPECFLLIIEAQNKIAFKLIMRHIKSIGEVSQSNFIQETNDDDQNGLILAASLGNEEIVNQLIIADLKFDILAEDNKGFSVLYYLAVKKLTLAFNKLVSTLPKIPLNQAKAIAEHADNLVDDTKNSKNEIGNKLTHSPDKVTQAGRISKVRKKEISRPYRSFKCDREIQLLRQLSTQLFFYLDKVADINGLVELQTMHLKYGDKHVLFITVNQHEISKYLMTITGKDKLQKILTETYTPRGEEGKLRSSRFVSKILSRIYNKAAIEALNETSNDSKNYLKIGHILRHGHIRQLPVSITEDYTLSEGSKALIKQRLEEKNNYIYLINVNDCKNKLRHAEEFLVDIAEFAKQLASESKKDIYTCIAGKKRPCIGCFARMENVIDNYNKYPGRFWLNTIENQSATNAAKTTAVILTKPSFITVCVDGKTPARDYCSGSDSNFSSGSESESESDDSSCSSPRRR